MKHGGDRYQIEMASASVLENRMHILLFGKTGQVATELRAQADKAGHRVTALGRTDVNLETSIGLETAVADYDPDIIINAAAFTDVDGAEVERETALAINAYAPFAIAKAAASHKTPFIHISTDYVFSGTGSKPWECTDPIDPINAYGASKAKGEELIATVRGRNIIVRTSWIFSPYGKNFLKTILRLAGQQSELRIVGDQVGGPTSAGDLASAILIIARKECDPTDSFAQFCETQILHFAGMPYASWAEFGEAIIASAGLNASVVPIQSSEFPTRANRPKNSRLDLTDVAHLYGITAPDWRKAVDDCIRRISE